MDFQLPELGEGVYEAEMVRWLVAEGAHVKPGQVLLEVLTDKATMEVPAPFAGAIESLRAAEGDKLKIGQVILTYQPAGAEAPKKSATPKQETPRKDAPVKEETAAPAPAKPSRLAPAPTRGGNGIPLPVKA